jgi:electron transport complex protein RnfC
VCPANLLPQQLYWHARAKELDKAQDYHLFDCIECACCDYVCPSQIPLVQYFRYAKTQIWMQEQERKRAELARRRHEFRQMRLERDKRERAERQRAAAAQAQLGAAEEEKKAAVRAAVERVQARRAAGLSPSAAEQTQASISTAQSELAPAPPRQAVEGAGPG